MRRSAPRTQLIDIERAVARHPLADARGGRGARDRFDQDRHRSTIRSRRAELALNGVAGEQAQLRRRQLQRCQYGGAEPLARRRPGRRRQRALGEDSRCERRGGLDGEAHGALRRRPGARRDRQGSLETRRRRPHAPGDRAAHVRQVRQAGARGHDRELQRRFAVPLLVGSRAAQRQPDPLHGLARAAGRSARGRSRAHRARAHHGQRQRGRAPALQRAPER